jgi:hypothetical protein
MAHAIHDLKAMQRSGAGDVGGVLARLREQEAAGRGAGFAPVVHLCQGAEDCLTLERLLTSDRVGTPAPQASMVAVLLDTCRTIQLHAEAVETMASYLRHRDGVGVLPG